MKAIVVREFGPPETMHLEEVPTPVPGPGEVLVAVRAVSVNRTLDLAVRAGTYVKKVTLPHILGVDPSGTIAALGPGVTGMNVGDRVATTSNIAGDGEEPRHLGVHLWGGYAEYVKLPVRNVFRIPDSLDFASATCVVRHAPTALHMLRDRARLKPQEWVLVMGASGGLGSFGIQVAKYLGAKVIAAAGADERVNAVLALGADVGVNYRTHDLTEEVLRITGGLGVDVVFENIGAPDLFPKAFASLGGGGRLVTAGGHGGGIVPLDIKHLYLKKITIMGATGRKAGDVEKALELAAEGRLRSLIDQVLPLDEAVQAHRIVEGRVMVGKVILEP